MTTDYDQAFGDALSAVRGEGRYRVFAELERACGDFPAARRRRPDGSWQDIVIWCSNACGVH